MKSSLLSLTVLCALCSHSQMYIDRNGDPVNRKCIPHIEKDDEVSVLAVGCCCDFSYMEVNPGGSPPSPITTAGRFLLTNDSLFINELTTDNINLDTLFQSLDDFKGSKITLSHSSLTPVFSIVEIMGQGTDHGNYWAFPIQYIDSPVSGYPVNRPTCMWWEYGVSYVAPNGFLPLTGGTMTGDVEYQGFWRRVAYQVFGSDTLAIEIDDDGNWNMWVKQAGNTISSVHVDEGGCSLNYQNFVTGENTGIGISDGAATVNITDVNNEGIEYNVNPTNLSDQTMIAYGHLKPVHGSGPPASAPTYEGFWYVDDTTIPKSVYYSVGTSSASDWVLMN